MSENFSSASDAPDYYETVPEKKNNKTLWIILAVAAVLILCCCCLVVFAMFVIPAAGEFDQLFYDLVPLLSMA